MISNERIIDAYLCLIDLHDDPSQTRQLHMLRPTDFQRIRNVKLRFDRLWRAEKLVYGPKEPYYQFRVRTLDRWQEEYRWTIKTRNLYASMLAKLSNWNRNGDRISAADRARLERVRPGAMPLLRHLIPEQTRTLL
jgi:hypothetical protein